MTMWASAALFVDALLFQVGQVSAVAFILTSSALLCLVVIPPLNHWAQR